jgi:autotransporter translocation and assembly factor TamB
LKRLIRVILIVVAAVAVAVVLLAMTPAGWWLLTGVIERFGSRATGMEVRLGALRGNLLAGATLDDLTLTVPGGPTVLRVDAARLRYDIAGLTSRRLEGSLRVDGANVVLERGTADSLVGWSRLASRLSSGPEKPAGRPWSVDVSLDLRSLSAAYEDTAAGVSARVESLMVVGRDGPGAFEASLRGAAGFASGALSAPVSADLAAHVRASGDTISVSGIKVRSSVASIDGSVRLALATADSTAPKLDFTATGDVSLEALADILPASDGSLELAGRVGFRASGAGPLTGYHYEASLESDELEIAGVEVAALSAAVSAGPGSVEIVLRKASVFDGEISADVKLLQTGEPAPSYNADATFAGLNVHGIARVVSAARGQEPPAVSGVASGHASVRVSGSGPSALSGDAAVSVVDLGVNDVSFGTASIVASAERSVVTVDAACCSTTVSATATVSGDGVGEAEFTIDVGSIGALAGRLGFPDWRGRALVRGTAGGPPEAPRFAVEAALPDVRYRGVQAGPARVEVDGASGRYSIGAAAFDGAVLADGAIDPGGAYAVTARVESLDLSFVVPESLRREMDFRGEVSAHVALSGDREGFAGAEGTVSALRFAARGQDLALEAPFRFKATSDSVEVTWISMAGSLGSFSVSGGVRREGPLDLALRIDGIDLGAAAAFVPASPAASPAGRLSGTMSLRGSLATPVFDADLAVDGLAVGQVDLGALRVEASNDSTDLSFSLDLESTENGSVIAVGAVPIRPDSLRALALDRDREFGFSAVFTDFTIDLQKLLPSGLRGERAFSIEGSVLLSGRADSLGTIYGRGSFDAATATLGTVTFSLVAPMSFEVVGGDVTLPVFDVAVERRRIVGDERGGEISVSGTFRHDRTFVVKATTDDLNVGDVVRAIAPRSTVAAEGLLTLSFTAEGDLDDPTASFEWRLDRPRLAGFGFDRFSGAGRIEDRVLTLDRASLEAGGEAIAATCRVPILARSPAGTGERAGAAPTFEARLWTPGGFHLDRLKLLPLAVSRLRGRVDIDLAASGALGSPEIEGSLTLRDGEAIVRGLSQRLRAASVDISADGRTVVLKRASVKLGSGSVEATGFAEFEAGQIPAFRIATSLNSPEITMARMFDARLGGNVVWAGGGSASRLSGKLVLEKLQVTYDVGPQNLFAGHPARVPVAAASNPLSRVALDLDIEIPDKVSVRNDVADLDFTGGFHFGGTALVPVASGGLTASGGTITYLRNKFRIETLSVDFRDPRRRDPYVDLVGTAEVDARSTGEHFIVTISVSGYLYEAVPRLQSSPSLSEPDIVALLTFGDTFAAILSGGSGPGSSGESFALLARRAFVSSVFGVAETTMERLLHLDTVLVDREAVEVGDIVGADVTVGKAFGERVTVNYTTAIGRFTDQSVELSLRLTNRLVVETRSDPEGNHAIDLKLHLTFR